MMSSDAISTPTVTEQSDNREPSSDLVPNGDVDDHVFSEELETLSLSGEEPSQSLYICPLCQSDYKQPRVLNCLHVFCESCLKPLLVEDSITCPTCGMVRLGFTSCMLIL